MKMKTNQSKKALASLLLLSTMASQLAAASVNVNQFNPAINPGYVYSEDSLMSSSWGAKGKGRPFFSAFYQMMNDPLVELNETRTQRRALLIDSINSLNLGFGYGIAQGIQLGASTSMNLVHLPNEANRFAFGDSRLFSKFRLNSDRAAFSFAIMPELYLPTGNRNLFLSNNSVGAGLKLIGEHDFGPVMMTANAGYRYSPKATYRDLNMKQAIPLSLGLLAPLGSKWAINAEARGDLAMPLDQYHNTSSYYFGGRYRIGDVVASLGGTVGTINGYYSMDYGAIAGIMVMPQTKEERVYVQQPAPAPMPAPVVAKVEPVKPRVIFTPKELIITEEVKFEHAKAVLSSSGRNLLDEVARVLKANKQSFTKISIDGHTNRIGSHAYNNKLSRERAASVKEYLISRGIPAQLLESMGYGKTRPKHVAGLSKDAQLAADRRVEFKVALDKKLVLAAAKAWQKKSKQTLTGEN